MEHPHDGPKVTGSLFHSVREARLYIRISSVIRICCPGLRLRRSVKRACVYDEVKSLMQINNRWVFVP